jgi:hypothetical protein
MSTIILIGKSSVKIRVQELDRVRVAASYFVPLLAGVSLNTKDLVSTPRVWLHARGENEFVNGI